jgi:hypothetical protein
VTGLDPTVVQALTRMLPKSRYPGDGVASAPPPEPVPTGTGSQPRPAGAPFNRDHGAAAVSPARQERAEAAAAAKREAERAAAKEAKEAKERAWAEMQLNALKERARQRQQLKESGHAQAWAERKGDSRPSSVRASRVDDCAQWQVPIRAAPPVSREASEIAWMRQVASQISEDHEKTQGGITPRVPSPPQPEVQVEPPKAAPKIVRRTVRQCTAPPVKPAVETEPQQEPAQSQAAVAGAVRRQHAWSKLDEDVQDSEDHESQIVPRVRLDAGRLRTPPVYKDAAALEPTAMKQSAAAQMDKAARVEPEEDTTHRDHERERQEILAEVRAIAAAAARADEKRDVRVSRPRRRQHEEQIEKDHEDQVEEEEAEVARAWREGTMEESEAHFRWSTQSEHEAVEAEAAAAEAAAEAEAKILAEAEAVEAARRAEERAAAEAARVAEAEEQELQARRVRERLAAIQIQEHAEAEARAARELEWERERQERRDAFLHNEQRCREEQEENDVRESAARRQAQAEADETKARRVPQSAGERARAAEARAAERRFVTAVCRLQALVRGRRGRRRAAAVSAARAASSGSSQWSLRQRAQEAAVVAAAVRLQAVVRGREGRRRAATVRERRREEQAIGLAMRGDGQQRRENLREVLSTLPTSRDALAAAADLCATQVSLPVNHAGSEASKHGQPAPTDNQQRAQPQPQQPPSQGQGCSSDDRETQEVKLVLKVEQPRSQRQPREQQQQGSGGPALFGGRANRRSVSHTSRGAKTGLGKGAPWHHAQAPRANASFPSPGDSVSVFVPLSGARTTTELLERCDEAIARVTGGGQRSSRCWSYATSRGELVDVDDFTELYDVRIRAAYLFATVCAQPSQ